MRRRLDITISLPIFLLAFLAGAFGPTTLNVVIAVAFITTAWWVPTMPGLSDHPRRTRHERVRRLAPRSS